MGKRLRLPVVANLEIVAGEGGDEAAVPILSRLPIIGNFFKSKADRKVRTELIVIVTPVIVDPLRPRAEDVMRLQADTTKPGLDALQRRLPPNQRRP